MANEEHLAILQQGVEVWNAWRKEHHTVLPDFSRAHLSRVHLSQMNLIRADLSYADLSYADISRAHLSRADLSHADLSEAILSGADFSGANLLLANLSRAFLSEANLSEANLIGANLSGTNLRLAKLRLVHLIGADLRGADLRGTDFTRANLSEVDFTLSQMAETSFSHNDLSETIGLDNVNHVGPSIIGINTLYRSAGKIPEVFLRGCGVPDAMIEYLPSLLGAMQPIQFYSCFISYSHKDEDFAQRLHQRMQAEKLRVWYAPEDMKAGHKLHEQIDEAIRMFDKLVLVLSAESIASEWVMTEIRKARKAELRDKRRKLFPIRLVEWDTIREWECFDADMGKDLAVEVREYFVPDFTQKAAESPVPSGRG